MAKDELKLDELLPPSPTPLGPEEETELDTTREGIPSKARKSALPPQGPGRMGNDNKALIEFSQFPKVRQRELVEETWAEIAYAAALRAKRFSKSALVGEFGKLQQIVTSAAIAKDKAYPNKDSAPQGNVILNLFGNMGAEALRHVLRPPMPVQEITVTPIQEGVKSDG